MAPLVDTEELAELGFTIVRGFLSREQCARARAAMDGQFGPERGEAIAAADADQASGTVSHETRLVGHPSQTHSGDYFHSLCHPNPAMTALVDAMPKMTQVHCEVLRSNTENICLNGQSMVRTDPYEGGGEVKSDTNPTNIHVDNAFLPAHDAATPREVYSRSIVYLNKVEAGGAPIILWPRAHRAAADVVQQLVAEDGEESYHGVHWRDEVIHAMTERPNDAPAGYDTRQVTWGGVGPAMEVLMDEGDLASASRPALPSTTAALG